MTSAVESLIVRLNTGKWAPAVGIDRVKLLPGPALRVQVGVRLFPKKAPIYDAVEQAINLAEEFNLVTTNLERQTRETFILTFEPRS